MTLLSKPLAVHSLKDIENEKKKKTFWLKNNHDCIKKYREESNFVFISFSPLHTSSFQYNTSFIAYHSIVSCLVCVHNVTSFLVMCTIIRFRLGFDIRFDSFHQTLSVLDNLLLDRSEFNLKYVLAAL